MGPSPGETYSHICRKDNDGEIQGASGHHRGRDYREHSEALAAPRAQSSGTHSSQEPSEGAHFSLRFPASRSEREHLSLV